MATKILSIHFSPDVVELAIIGRVGNRHTTLEWAIEHILPDEDVETFQARALSSFIKKNKKCPKKAVVVISGSELHCKLISLPLVSEKELPQVIKLELEAILPPSTGSKVIDFYKVKEVEPQKEKQLFFTATISHEYIKKIIDTLGTVGLSAKNILTAPEALANLIEIPTKELYSLVNISESSMLIVIVKKGQVVFCREVVVGIKNIRQSMQGVLATSHGQFKIDAGKADDLLANDGIPIDAEDYYLRSGVPGNEVLGMIRPVLEKMGAEILRTFESFKSESQGSDQFKDIYLSGVGAQIINLPAYFADVLNLTVEILPIGMESFDKDFNKNSSSLAIVLGGGFYNIHNLSFLPEEFKAPLGFLLKKIFFNVWGAFISGILIFVLSLTMVWNVFLSEYDSARIRLVTLQTEMMRMGLKLQEKSQASGSSAIELMQTLGAANKIDRFTNILELLDQITPIDIYLNGLQYNRQSNSLVMKGIIFASNKDTGVAKFLLGLRKSKYVASADLSYLTVSDRYTVPTYDFEIRAILSVGHKK